MTASAAPVALVTGSGKRRIGFHVAVGLARRGYALAIHYRSSRSEAAETIAEIQKLGVEVLGVQADLADEPAIEAMIVQVMNKFGRLDVLVNCAAIWQRKKLEEVTAADVRRHFEINTLGTFLCSRRAGLTMVDQPAGGSIVTFGDWAIERPYMDYAAYFPSKGAIPALTKSLAVELGSRNPKVRVNCILPGPLMLPDDMSENERRQAVHGTLVHRAGRPEDAVSAVLFLIENTFLTGVCFPVDGGRTIYAAHSIGPR